jgi:ketosteroid isomerase-like protein
MGKPEDNVSKLREAYRLWHETKGGSVQHWLDLMADDVSLDSLGNPPDKTKMTHMRRQQSKVDAVEYFTGLNENWEMLAFTADEFIAEGDRVVMLGSCSFRFKKTGKTAKSKKADVFRFRDGKIVEYFEYFDTAAAYTATQADGAETIH